MNAKWEGSAIHCVLRSLFAENYKKEHHSEQKKGGFRASRRKTPEDFCGKSTRKNAKSMRIFSRYTKV